MASISYKEVEEKLIRLGETATAENLGYKLLTAFGMTDTSVKRVMDGKANLDTDGGILVKKKLAYRAASTEKMNSELEAMKADAKIAKAAPGIIAVSDGRVILAYDPFEKESYEAPISKIRLDYHFFYPISGEARRSKAILENEADVRAAEKMAKLYDEIRRYNEFTTPEEVHQLNIFLTRILFCYFAEDTGIFDTENLFTDSIRKFTKDDGSDLSLYLDEIFVVMNRSLRLNTSSNIAQFPYVNGGLFAKRIPIPQMGWRARQILLECGGLNWAKINPDIFGSMIQAVVTPESRGNLGMHYTSVPNIMKLIQPLFLDELYEAFYAAKESEKKLNTLLVRISKIKFFDPACGSGNFLIITYKELRKLEILIWKQIRQLTGQALIPYVSTQLGQFYGIELDDFAHETAILALWLAEHQMNNEFYNEFAVRVQALPLRPSGNIVQGNACRVDWDRVCPHTPEEEVYVMGNPPYLGSKIQSAEQKADIDFAFKSHKVSKILDYIAIWFYYGAKYISGTNASYAFVSTNSICQGEQVGLLWPLILKQNVEISFAVTSFKWTNNAKGQAGVTCVIVGVKQSNLQKIKKIYSENITQNVDSINPYLTAGKNVIVNKLTRPISGFPEIKFGCMPYDNGNLILNSQEKDELTAKYPDTHKLIKRLVGSLEFIRGEDRFCLWISDRDFDFANHIAEINQRIEKVRNLRLKCKDEAGLKLANRPHQFREFVEINSDSIIIPAVSSEKREYIPMGFLNSDTIISNSAFAIYDSKPWLFGILTSKMHMAWVRTVGGRLKSDYRYSAQLCYNTFPFPHITESKRKALEAAAEEVLFARANHTEKTLAQMYDPDKMPADLRAAHSALDRMVDSCYREKPFESDEERLEWLFRLYEKMVKNV